MSSYISYLSPGNGSALALREADDSRVPIRVALFGSFYGGLTVLEELTRLGPQVVIAGLATDDPRQSYTHPGVRLWRYPHDPAEEGMVQKLGEAHGLEAYTGRINTLAFRSLFFEDWNPDLCLMATFGQRIPEPIFRHPPLGFFNFHHSDAHWPSYPGPDPVAQMIRDRKRQIFLNLHRVTDTIDGGERIARSGPIPLLPWMDAATLHRRSWPRLRGFVREQIALLAGVGPGRRDFH